MTSPTLVETPHGPAALHRHPATTPRGVLVLGHGAGGGVTAPDLVGATTAALAVGVTVVLVEQPYRVAGRKAPPRAPVLDAAWLAVVDHVRRAEGAGLPLLTGGRSSGARVACRTAQEAEAVGVLCLAFPLRPPRRQDKEQAPSRLPELAAVTVPLLVVQGDRDPFGLPPAGPGRDVVVLAGDHALRSEAAALREAVGSWLSSTLAARG